MTDEWEPTLEQQFAGRMDAADRAVLADDVALAKCRHCGAVPYSIGWCCTGAVHEANTVTD